jgi:predicted cupin superfamily sugar epimerase
LTSKQEYIEHLNLETHPEGGWFKETYHSDEKYYASESNGERYYYTSIMFLIDNDNPSHFHRLNHDELWFYHDGQNMFVHCIYPNGEYKAIKLGNDINKGELPQFMVPKGTIFASSVDGKDDFALVSCVVSPGFDYADFELMHKSDLLTKYPNLETVIKRLTLE